MGKTSIEWTEFSWNPIRARNRATGKQGHYCQRISAGCTHCYAASMNRWRGNGVDYTVPGLSEVDLYLDEDTLLEPLRWRKPRSVFVCSMTDLFADFVPDEWIERIYAVMALAAKCTFMVLTKRPARRSEWSSSPEARRSVGIMIVDIADSIVTAQRSVSMPLCERPDSTEDNPLFWAQWPLPNVREGASICTQKEWDDQVQHLLNTPAALRWISMEPMLERIEMNPVRVRDGVRQDALYGSDGIRWVVVGGESGRKARPCALEWIQYVTIQCRDAKVPCFVKQLGSANATPGASKGEDISAWPEYLRVREMPQ